ncbi:hypothetical protein D3C86_2061490 [compost metagenome]
MADIGVAVLEEAAAADDGLVDPARGHHRANRLVAGAEALGDGDDVRHHAVFRAGKEMAGAAHA